MLPATLTYYGYSARDVCLQLAYYKPEERVVHAVDALVTAIAFMRLDTVHALKTLEVPRKTVGLLGITVETAEKTRLPIKRKLITIIDDQ